MEYIKLCLLSGRKYLQNLKILLWLLKIIYRVIIYHLVEEEIVWKWSMCFDMNDNDQVSGWTLFVFEKLVPTE